MAGKVRNRRLPSSGRCGQEIEDALNYLCEYSLDKKYDYKFALEAKPNEPRADIYMPTTGAYLALISTLARPEMVGVNPEVMNTWPVRKHDPRCGLGVKAEQTFSYRS